MIPRPIALLVDDPTPLVHLYRHHVYDLRAKRVPAGDGRELEEVVPNEFLGEFCHVVRRRGMAGKFSIVPAPQNRGDVVRGIAGFDPALTRQWIARARDGLRDRFDFSPEMITHSWAVDLETGAPLDENEHDWSQHQDRTTLAPYIARALSLLKQAGIDATGVTSPWMFGERVEGEYVRAIAAAQRKVNGRTFSWYLLHIRDDPAARPRVVLEEDGAAVVSVPTCTDDLLWDTVWKHGRADASLIGALADRFLTADGRGGVIRRTLDAGGWPVLPVHWPSLFSNGHATGLAVLDEVGRRVGESLGGEVRWASCLEMSRLVEGKAGP